MAVVYQHRRLDTNEIFYIGIGKTEKRAMSIHSRNKYWKHIISKTEYEVEILFDDLTWEKACEKEIELIKLYGRKDLGLGTLVNMTDGGEGSLGNKMSEDTKEKLRKINLGKKMLPESIERTRQSNIGRKHSIESIEKNRQSNLGKKRSPESIERTRQKNIGKKRTEETKEKMRIKAIGRILTEDTKVKLRKPKSEQSKENMRLAWIKRKENINV